MPRRRHSASDSSRRSLRKVAAASAIRPKITARSSSVRSTRPALATRPPSSISWRVRSRRFITHARLSSRAILACRRWRATITRLPALRAAASAAARTGRALKVGYAAFAPALLRTGVLVLDASEQQTGQLLDRQRVSSGCDQQRAKLVELAVLEMSGLVVQRFQFGIEIAGLRIGPSPIAW